MTEEVAPKKMWSPTVRLLTLEEVTAMATPKTGVLWDGIDLKWYGEEELREIVIGLLNALRKHS